MRIVHYFSPMSGYAYLGIGALCDMAARRGATIAHRPIDIQRLFAAVETTAPAKRSAAQRAWRTRDMALWAQCRGLPLNAAPRHWPVNASLAARAIIAAQRRGADDAALAQACLAAVWAHDLDIADADVLASLARDCGLDADAVMADARTPACEALFQANTDAAIAAGVVGSPTVFVGDAMFFGQDRFDFVEAELAQAMLA